MKFAKATLTLTVCFSTLIGFSDVKADTNDINQQIDERLQAIDLQVGKLDNNIDLQQNQKEILNEQINKIQTAILENGNQVNGAEQQLLSMKQDIQTLQIGIDQLRSKLLYNRPDFTAPMNIASYTEIKPLEFLQEPSTFESNPLFVNSSQLKGLLFKEAEMQEKIKEFNTLKIELGGMSEQLTEQKDEKTNLLDELNHEVESNQNAKDNLLQESKTLSKQKSEIEKAIQNEAARKEGKIVYPQYQPSTDVTVSIVSDAPGKVPKQYMQDYLYAEQKYGIPWYYLAALHSVETSFSQSPIMISAVGAIGPFQFMPATWVGYKYETSGGLVPAGLDITNLQTIKDGGGYGVDADNDGIASPWSVADSAATAAKFLSANGFNQDIRGAIFQYNHANWYVDKVMSLAEIYKNSVPVNENETVKLSPDSENKVTTVGNRWINNSVYVFGGGRNQSDINQGKFDCSSFVYWAFSQVGINLGDLTSVSTDTLKNLGKSVSESDMQPGDLVFFDTYKKDGHVGIYLGDGKFIGAQSSTGVAVADMSSGYWKAAFNHRVRRITK